MTQRVATRRRFLHQISTTALSGSALGWLACEARSKPENNKDAEHSPAEPDHAVKDAPDNDSAGRGPFVPAELDETKLIVHGLSPLNLETKREAFLSSYLTPLDRAYVRANLPLPPASIVEDRDAWTVTIQTPSLQRTMTLHELKQVGMTTTTAVLQCSGNGRAYFQHEPSGSPWKVGAVANLMWTGVSLRDLLAYLGDDKLDKLPPWLTATGGEPIPAGLNERDVVVERSIPTSKGVKDVMLAWAVNGEDLSLARGGPLRLVVPGYYGVNFVKYLQTLKFSKTESDAKIQSSGYRIRPIGEAGAPSQPTMAAMPVKSFLTLPAKASLTAGQVQFIGVAFAGESAIDAVELSFDDGNSWIAAKLVGPDLGPAAWRQFSLVQNMKPGRYRVASRARASDGTVQPKERQENERGYGNNSWHDMAIEIEVVA